MAICAFCGEDRKLTREHTFSREWLASVMPGDGSFVHTHRREGTSGFQRLWTKNEADLKVKAFCAECNNGWMNELDRDVAPIRDPIVRGEWTSLPVEAQELLASWICKIAMVADQAGKEAGFSQGDREYLYRYRKPPLGFWIWVAGVKRLPDLWDAWSQTHKLRSDKAYGCINTFGVNHLVAQTLVPPLREIAKPSRDLNKDLLSRIWPRTPETKAWPPTLLMRREDLPELTRAFITDFDYI
jgi:hypothetical protein